MPKSDLQILQCNIERGHSFNGISRSTLSFIKSTVRII